ncbi:hypothetical protein VPH35_074804 [Triticum aestivum]
MALPGGPATPTPEPEPLRLAEEEVREAELFEDAVDVSPTASAHPVTWREGEAAPSSSSPSMSVSIPHRHEAGAADEEEEAYESPPASGASGHTGIDGAGWSPSVSESREGSASPLGQRARGAEQQEGNWVAPSGAAGSPGMEDSRSRSSSAPPSPRPPSSPAPQIRPHARHVRTSSFQRFRQQMQRAWKWGPVGGGGDAERSPREQLLRTTVNIEAMANQKRQWYQVHAKDQNQLKEPSSLFEHFFVVGLHSYANVAVVEDAFAKKKAWESNVACSEVVDLSKIQYHGPIPTMEPQILFKYPPGKKEDIREADLPSFCFPEGVKARLVERTPSMSDLNEVIFGQVFSIVLFLLIVVDDTRVWSLYTVKGAGSDEEDDEVNVKNESGVDDGKVLGWAKANNNEPLQIVCGYHALPLPPRGGEIVFQPLEHLQPVKYSRPGLLSLGLGDTNLNNDMNSAETNLVIVNARLVAAEEALALSIWTMATVCRALSLESMLALFTGVLLEKQIVVICPNLGVLSAIVLSIIPMIRPFQWQSLLLPVLPRKLIDFIDAPVPFIAGIQHKPPDIKMKASSLVRINVQKDQVKANLLPQLPRYKDLVSDLSPIHARLSCENALAKKHPMYKCNEVQAKASWQFLNVLRTYLESLCSELRYNTITNVQSDNDRVSLLLKDSFIDSFPSKDRPFMKLFVETQMFSVLSDSRLAAFENEHSQGFASAGDQNTNFD